MKAAIIFLIGLVVIYAAPTVRLTKRINDDLLTEDLIKLSRDLKEKESNQSVFDDIAAIDDVDERMKYVKKTYPHLYPTMKEYTDALLTHMRIMDNREAVVFYGNYIDKVVETIGQEKDFQENFLKLMKYSIPEWEKLSTDARMAFETEFPDVAKHLNDEKIQSMVNTEARLVNIEQTKELDRVEQKTHQEEENKPKGLWETWKNLLHGPSIFN